MTLEQAEAALAALREKLEAELGEAKKAASSRKRREEVVGFIMEGSEDVTRLKERLMDRRAEASRHAVDFARMAFEHAEKMEGYSTANAAMDKLLSLYQRAFKVISGDGE